MAIEKRRLWGYINKSGEYVIAPQFDGAADFHEGLGMVKIDWRGGYVNKKGDIAIELQFQHANSFSEGLAAVMLDDKWGYINKEGLYTIPLQYDNAMDFQNGIAQVKIGDDWIFINKDGEQVPGPAGVTQNSSDHSEWPKLKIEGEKIGYVNEKDEFVIKPVFFDAGPFSEGLARVKKGRTSPWIFIDETGKPAFKEKFEAASDFHEGLAKVLVKEEV